MSGARGSFRMTQHKNPNGATTAAMGGSAVVYDRREALVALLSVPIALAAGTSSATEGVQYPLSDRGAPAYLRLALDRNQSDCECKCEGLDATLWHRSQQASEQLAQSLRSRTAVASREDCRCA